MKIKELRIGNLVRCKRSNDAGVYVVYRLDYLTEVIMLNGSRLNEIHYTSDILPIPITKEYLEKFGFEDMYTANVMGEYIIKKQSDDEWSFDIEYQTGEYHTLVYLKYVHQLQNLMFALTGNEYTI